MNLFAHLKSRSRGDCHHLEEVKVKVKVEAEVAGEVAGEVQSPQRSTSIDVY